jgi:hypothetical protein
MLWREFNYDFPDDDDAYLLRVLDALPAEISKDFIWEYFGWHLQVPNSSVVVTLKLTVEDLVTDSDLLRANEIWVPDGRKADCITVLDHLSNSPHQWSRCIRASFQTAEAEGRLDQMLDALSQGNHH